MATIVRAATAAYGTVQDEGTPLTPRAALNFIGPGVTVTDNSGSGRTEVTIPGGAGSGYSTIAEEGSTLTQRGVLNFVGAAVTATDNPGTGRTDITVQVLPAVHAVGNAGTALTLNAAATGPIKMVTLNSSSCTITLAGSASGVETTMEVYVTQDATGGRLISWPAPTILKWPGGVAPTLTTTAGGVDRFLLTHPGTGTVWYGDTIGKAYA